MKIKEKTTPFGVKLLKSPVFYRADPQGDAQTLPSPSLDTEGCQACSQLPESKAACSTSGSGRVGSSETSAVLLCY